jgi:sec-independent protein translocase protein TatA
MGKWRICCKTLLFPRGEKEQAKEDLFASVNCRRYLPFMFTMNPFLAIGPLGPMEMLVVFVAILMLFGAKRLPQLARSMGKSLGEFRRAKEEFENEIREAGKELEEESSLNTNPKGRRTRDQH